MFPGSPPTRPMSPRLWDVAGAVEWLDNQGIDVHVTGVWADVFGYTLPADEAADWSRFINEATLEGLAMRRVSSRWPRCQSRADGMPHRSSKLLTAWACEA